MRRDQLEHIIRAAADLTNETDFIIIGSQAILGRHPNAPAPLLVSMEADIYARNRPDLSDDIDGNLGRGSRFDQTFGYHADGVSPTTATLPKGWDTRLSPIRNANTRGATGWCIDTHDLAIAKYVAGREKDLAYNATLWERGLLNPTTIAARLQDTPLDPDHRERIARTIRHQQAAAHAAGTNRRGGYKRD